MTEKIRLSKLMSERGICSRREADSLIERGWVLVDGIPVTELGTRIDPAQVIALDPRARGEQEQRVTILLNKPAGYVSGQPEDGHEPAIVLIKPQTRYEKDLVPIKFRLAHLNGLAAAGRLDIDSQGLIVFTQDGRIAKQLIGSDTKIEKEYRVRVEGDVSEQVLAQLRHGLHLDGRALRPAEVMQLPDGRLRFVLREGRKRQIRRMCEMMGLSVSGLKRIRIGNVHLGPLPSGQWRYLGPGETFG